jgi:hypothetical protein
MLFYAHKISKKELPALFSLSEEQKKKVLQIRSSKKLIK